jgi:hypothetical protein
LLHIDKHDVPSAQITPPVHGAVVVLHMPEPLHVPAVVRLPFEHTGELHMVPEVTCSQSPPAAQLPSLPHGGAAVHWPAGAGVPAVMLAQVPSMLPVSAIEHAWQLPLHAVLQQIWLPPGPMQLP